MANHYIHTSFGFRAPDKERRYLEELVTTDWGSDECDPRLRGMIFDDYPSLGATFDFNHKAGTVHVYDDAGSPDLEAIAKVIQLAGIYQVGFTWAETCDKARLDAFGGGYCLILPKKIRRGNVQTLLEAERRG